MKWCPCSDLNGDCAGFEAADSAGWSTRAGDVRLSAERAARLRSSSYGVAAFPDFATRGIAGLPSRSWRSQRRLVRAEGFEPTPLEGLVSKTSASAVPPRSHEMGLSTGYDPVFPPYQSGVLPNERREH